MICLDTHVVVWLHANRLNAFPEQTKQLLNKGDLRICPAAFLEMEYLFESGKIRFHAEDIFSYLERQIGLAFSSTSFEWICRKATTLNWTRDPFDRMIVADAFASDAVLVTKDTEILEHYPKAFWK